LRAGQQSHRGAERRCLRFGPTRAPQVPPQQEPDESNQDSAREAQRFELRHLIDVAQRRFEDCNARPGNRG
jgi:hypothetical protein